MARNGKPIYTVATKYNYNKAFKLIEAKIGTKYAKFAYDRVSYWQAQGRTIDLLMWYTLINYRENAKWNFKANHQNPDGTWDCGLGQVNMKRCTTKSFEPEWGIEKSTSILAQKNKYAAGSKWHTFKRYNGAGAMATEYAKVCWDYYTQLGGKA